MGDLGVNARIDQAYKKHYTTELAVKRDEFGDYDRVNCILKAIKCCNSNEGKSVTRNAWAATGFILEASTNSIDLAAYRQVKKYASGARSRDPELPKVTSAFLDQVFALRNLVQPQEAPIDLDSTFGSFPPKMKAILDAKTSGLHDGRPDQSVVSYVLSKLGDTESTRRRLLFWPADWDSGGN